MFASHLRKNGVSGLVANRFKYRAKLRLVELVEDRVESLDVSHESLSALVESVESNRVLNLRVLPSFIYLP